MNMTYSDRNFHKEVGVVVSAKEYLLTIEGFPSARVDDLIKDEKGNRAIITALKESETEALLLDSAMLKPGDKFFSEKDRNIFSFGDHLFGHVINGYGEYLDVSGVRERKNTELELNVVALGIYDRVDINKQFITGITAIDTLFPIGKGQRQLVFGATNSGKTTLLQNIIHNQEKQETVCIYAAIGKPLDDIRKISNGIFRGGKDSKTILLAIPSNDSSPMIAIAPSIAFSLAEFFRKQNRDVLLILDDLGTHAKYLREISLLQGRLPGQESYPGDVFYQHAHLMERSGAFNKEAGGGTITLLPVLETDIKNITDLIPTNIMASTDGHFSLSATVCAQGYYPTISLEQSVTRVGRNTQCLIQKQIATEILVKLSEYKKQEEFSRFGTQASTKTQKKLHRGRLILEILKQSPSENIPPDAQVLMLGLSLTHFLIDRDMEFLKKNKKILIKTASKNKNLEIVREAARKDISLNSFLNILNSHLSVFEEICHP